MGLRQGLSPIIVQVVFNQSTGTTSGKLSLSSGKRLIAGPITLPAKLSSLRPFINVNIVRTNDSGRLISLVDDHGVYSNLKREIGLNSAPKAFHTVCLKGDVVIKEPNERLRPKANAFISLGGGASW